MQFTHEVTVMVEASARDVWAHWADVSRLPRLLSHLRATAPGDAEDLARLVIVLDGRHIEFAAERTMCEDHTLCWQSLGATFLYVLSADIQPTRDGTQLTIHVAYDPPGFLPDIAQSLGLTRAFRRTLEADLARYAKTVRRPEQSTLALAS